MATRKGAEAVCAAANEIAPGPWGAGAMEVAVKLAQSDRRALPMLVAMVPKMLTIWFPSVAT
jgi:hypothetical protein